MALNYHEPYASSASELVTELMQYLLEPSDVLKCEAEALLAGIVLDTKNFTNRTCGAPAPTPRMYSACSRATCSPW